MRACGVDIARAPCEALADFIAFVRHLGVTPQWYRARFQNKSDAG
jgi:hypothetical protein